MDELYNTTPGRESLPLADERELLAAAQSGDGDAVWKLLVQYRGILMKTANSIRAAVRGLTPEQVEDLQADLVLEAVEVIKNFDLTKYARLSQVLPRRLKARATEMTTSLAIPRGTLARWFQIWREADQDFTAGAILAPQRGMASDTFRAIQHALDHADSEWVTVPWAGAPSAQDTATYNLAHYALTLLSPAERDVVEHVYGFRGEPKSDNDIALILDSTPGTVKTQRKRALAKMQAKLIW